MTLEQTSLESHARHPVGAESALRLLQLAAHLLLEYSARTETILRQIDRIAVHLDFSVSTSVSYREVTLITADRESCNVQVPELRLNAAVNMLTLRVIDDFCADRIGVEEAILQLENSGHSKPQYNRWLLALVFGIGASALAWILRGDWGTIVVSGLSSGLGLIARKELARRHVIFFALPFTAAFIGAALGGAAILVGWTQTPGICLIVPALMLVPGPHLIHSVQEMLENHMQAGIARLGLAVTILVAAALGVLLGVRVTLGVTGATTSPSPMTQLTLPLDLVLAGAAACAFGAFYDTPRRVLWVTFVMGMLGHGIRFICMEQGMSQELATLLGCLAIGLAAMLAGVRLQLPFATVAFAGAVPMMPGLFIYEGFAGALRISAAGRGVDPALVAVCVALFFKAAFVVGAMVIGLLLGARIAGWLGNLMWSRSTRI